MFESILGPFLSLILLYKYWAIFVLSVGGAFMLPLPVTAMLAAAGAFVYQGYLNFWLALAVGFIGNVAGDLIVFAIARRYGELALHRLGFRKLMKSSAYKQIQEYLLLHPRSLIFFTRFFAITGPSVNILAGIFDLPWKKFLLYDLLGEFSYVAVFMLLGYLLGTQWDAQIGFYISVAGIFLLFGLIVNIAQYLLLRRRSR